MIRPRQAEFPRFLPPYSFPPPETIMGEVRGRPVSMSVTFVST